MELGPLKLGPQSATAVSGEVLVKGKLDVTLIQAWLATAEAYRAAGLTPQPALQSVKITPKSAAPGGPGDVVLQFQGLPSTLQEYDLLLIVSDRKSVVLGEYRVDTRSGAREFAAAPVGTQLTGRRGATAVAAAPAKPAVAATPSGEPAAAVASTPPATPAPLAASALAQAQDAVEAWAQAWSRKDVDAYVAAYEPTYAGRVAGSSRDAWVRERTDRIQARRNISVQLSNLRTEAQGDTVVATFVQTYRGDDTVIRSRKRLVLAPAADGRWLIRSETEGS